MEIRLQNLYIKKISTSSRRTHNFSTTNSTLKPTLRLSTILLCQASLVLIANWLIQLKAILVTFTLFWSFWSAGSLVPILHSITTQFLWFVLNQNWYKVVAILSSDWSVHLLLHCLLFYLLLLSFTFCIREIMKSLVFLRHRKEPQLNCLPFSSQSFN